MKLKIYVTVMVLFSILGLASCSNEDVFYNEDDLHGEKTEVVGVSKNTLMCDFAKVLSKAVYNNKNVREFLKKESIRQFDKDYDILYASVKNETIGDKTFRSILVENSSEDFIKLVEKNVPQLNILFSNISIFGINAENYDCNDPELPVAVSNEKETSLYFNGDCTNHLQKGEVPSFHVLVVNENERVIVNNQTRNGGSVYTFISPNFDNTQVTRTGVTPANHVGQKAIDAYSYFNKNDNSVYSRAFQRDYIYYRMTPTTQKGALDYNSREYITYIEVDPKKYFNIADDTETTANGDPYIKNPFATKEKNDFTQQELIDALWTQGAYEFKIEVIKSTGSEPEILQVSLRPEDIWNFNLERNYRHSTMFRHSKYTYYINASKFTAKRYYFNPDLLSLGKWDLSQEAITRRVHFEETDPSGTTEYTYECEWNKMLSSKFNGDVKLTIGLGGNNNISGGISSETTNSNTTREKTTVKVTRQTGSDDLGYATIYFYDPIINSKTTDGKYQLHEYNTGSVVFAITAN